MASSNRHWPSLFKSKPCNTHHQHHQWQNDINHSSLLSGSCQKPSYTSVPAAGCEERSPEPKPRWNPKPEQIRILEAIFNSGMVNPPRDEIRKIRAQLQEYGQVGDANVFYWFQNRKSRSKHKQRHLNSSRPQSRSAVAPSPAVVASTALPSAATSSSSSSSELSSGSDKILPLASVGLTNMIEASANQTYFHAPPTEFLVEPLYLQGTQGFCLSAAAATGEFSGVVGVPEQGMPGMWSELVMGQEGCKCSGMEEGKMKVQNPNPNPSVAAGHYVGATTAASATGGVAGPVNEIQGVGVGGAARSTVVFINEVAFEVVPGPLNVREAFGEEAVLIHSSGHPVLTDEWGLTLHPLQHGASYYLV